MRLTAMKKRLGDILVDVGIISPAQLQEALDIQKRTGGKLGTILSQMGVINEEVMLAFLGKQCGVSYISLAEYGDIPQEIIHSVPESIIRHQNLIPISRDNNTLTIAMSDPFNIFAVDDVRLMTGLDLQVVIASETEIKSAINKYYSHQPDLENLLLSASLPQDPKRSLENTLMALLRHALGANAATVYIEPQTADQYRVRYKIDGTIHEQSCVSKELAEILIRQIRSAPPFNSLHDVPAEGIVPVSVGGHQIKLWISLLPAVNGERTVLRILSPDAMPPGTDKLGFETETLSVYKKNIEVTGGLILVSGTADSGKTTTLYSTLQALNYPDRDIVTVEEPVEYVLPGIAQMQVNPASGLSLSAGIRCLLKQDPDVLMVGEVRDRETAHAVIDAALTGHTVFSSMTANNPFDAILRLCRMNLDSILVASALVMVVNQRLMRTICPACKESYEVARNSLKSLGIESQNLISNEKVVLKRGRGCLACNYTGYLGRTAVFEVLELDEDFRKTIIEYPNESALVSAGRGKIAMSLQESALRKVLAGVSTAEEMLRITKLICS